MWEAHQVLNYVEKIRKANDPSKPNVVKSNLPRRQRKPKPATPA